LLKVDLNTINQSNQTKPSHRIWTSLFVPYSCVGNSSFSIGFWNCTESVIFFAFHLIIF
jgi:hypothetical protein